MIKIEIKTGVATTRNVNVSKGRNAGTVMQMTEQEAWAFTVDQQGTPHPYPSRIVLDIEQGAQPYPPGFYTIAPASVYVGDFSKLKLGRVKLTPIQTSARAAA